MDMNLVSNGSNRLDRLESLHVFSRNDDLYKTHLFKSRWQPLPAWIGIIGCGFVIVWSGIPPLIILITKGSLTSTGTIKSTTSLAFDVVGAYIGVCISLQSLRSLLNLLQPFLFAVLYFTYKYIHPRSSRVDIRNLTVADYVLEDLSTIELDDTLDTLSDESPRESHELATQSNRIDDSISAAAGQPLDGESQTSDEEMGIERQAEIEARDAKRRELQRITQILGRRPKRLELGFWRELWSFVVSD